MHQATALRAYLSFALLLLASLLFAASCASTREKPATPEPHATAKAAAPAKADKSPEPASQNETRVEMTDLWSDPEDRPLSSVV